MPAENVGNPGQLIIELYTSWCELSLVLDSVEDILGHLHVELLKLLLRRPCVLLLLQTRRTDPHRRNILINPLQIQLFVGGRALRVLLGALPCGELFIETWGLWWQWLHVNAFPKTEDIFVSLYALLCKVNDFERRLRLDSP